MTRREMRQRIRELEAVIVRLEARVIRLEQRDPVLSAKPQRWTWEQVVLDKTDNDEAPKLRWHWGDGTSAGAHWQL